MLSACYSGICDFVLRMFIGDFEMFIGDLSPFCSLAFSIMSFSPLSSLETFLGILMQSLPFPKLSAFP